MTSALMLIDYQQGRDDAWFGKGNNPAAEANGLALLATRRARDLPRGIVQHASVTPGWPLSPDRPGFALDGEKHIVKQQNSAFIGTDLGDWLAARGIARLTVAGMTTEHCVSTTVRMASNLGYSVALAGDACRAKAKRRAGGDGLIAETIHQTELAILDSEFAHVITTADAIDALPAA
jgi:nicotinamidase-related amidase